MRRRGLFCLRALDFKRGLVFICSSFLRKRSQKLSVFAEATSKLSAALPPVFAEAVCQKAKSLFLRPPFAKGLVKEARSCSLCWRSTSVTFCKIEILYPELVPKPLVLRLLLHHDTLLVSIFDTNISI